MQIPQNTDPRSLVEEELENQESILWIGQPDPVKFAKRYRPVFVFAFLWTAFALFWTASASGLTRHGAHHFGAFGLFGLPFIGIGIFLFTVPLLARKGAGKTIYAVTNLRAIIIEFGSAKKVQSFGPDKIRNLERKEQPDGSGDIILDRVIERFDNRSSTTTEVGFFAISDVKEVEKTLLGLVQQRKTG